MEKICIIYDSKHNMNTEKLVLSLKETYNDVDIIKVNNFDISTINNYQKVGLASGIYWGKFSKNIEDLLNKILDSDIKNETINFFKNNGVSLYPNGFSLNNYFEFFYQLEDNCFKLYDNNDICINSVKEIKFIFEKPSLIGQILLKLKNSFIYSDNVLVNIYSIKFELNNKKKDIILENIERVVNSSLSEIECYINKELVFIETENFEDDLYNEDQFEHDENIINALNNKNVEVNYLIENSLLIELLNNMYRINRKKTFPCIF